jgi:hypothetical protein
MEAMHEAIAGERPAQRFVDRLVRMTATDCDGAML